jgi:hypothetical protein
LNFGHTYGGLYEASADDLQCETISQRQGVGPNASSSNDDPFVDPLIVHALSQTLKKPGQPIVAHQQTHPIVTDECFAKLPLEIVEFILMNLRSKDVLHARIASRVLASARLSQAFWRSRFVPGNDFEHFPEPVLCKMKSHPVSAEHSELFADAEAAYDGLTNGAWNVCWKALDNRKRVWGIIQPLSAALLSFDLHARYARSREPCGNRLASVWQEELEWEMDTLWHCGHGELLDSEDQPFHFGCRPLFKRNVRLKKRVINVRVSVLPWYTTSYVTGLRFIFEDSTEVSLGYVLEDREIDFAVEGGLRGFELAIGERGIHGMNIGMGGWKMPHPRVGDFERLKIKKIGEGQEVAQVKAYFDGMKLVYLGVPHYIHAPLGPYSSWKKAKGYTELLEAKKELDRLDGLSRKKEPRW